ISLRANDRHKQTTRHYLSRIKAKTCHRYVQVADYLSHRNTVEYVFQRFHCNSIDMGVPIFNDCPAAFDCVTTLPLPVTLVRYPAFSSAYSASINPIPSTSGTTPSLISASENGIPLTVSIDGIGSAEA